MSSIKVTFLQADGSKRTIEDIKPGRTVMETGRDNGIPGILGDCGGGCSCATCHVYVSAEWQDRVGLPDDIEGQMLDMTSNAKSNSRLSCQIKLQPELDGLTVTVANDS